MARNLIRLSLRRGEGGVFEPLTEVRREDGIESVLHLSLLKYLSLGPLEIFEGHHHHRNIVLGLFEETSRHDGLHCTHTEVVVALGGLQGVVDPLPPYPYNFLALQLIVDAVSGQNYEV